MLRIRRMTIADIPFGMHLKERAGWNQVEADWRRLLDLQPDGGFLAEIENHPVGTVMTCRFGPVAWVAMMLVDEAFRGRGIGRALMTQALDDLDLQGVTTIRLDATPLGQPLYESLGFATETTLARFAGTLPAADGLPRPSEARGSEMLDEIIALDRDVTGTDRGRLLRRLAEEQPESLQVLGNDHRIKGFLMARPGSRARQIGPCIAQDDAGPLLFAEVRRRYAGESVFIDIPTGNTEASALAGSWGLSPGRMLTRMGRGPRIEEDIVRLWASAGPEKG